MTTCIHCRAEIEPWKDGDFGFIHVHYEDFIKCRRPAEPAATEGTQDLEHELWYLGNRLRDELKASLTLHPENWHAEGLNQIIAQWDTVAKHHVEKLMSPAAPAATGTQEGQAMNLPQTGGVYIGLHEHQNVVPAEPSTPETTELPPLDVMQDERDAAREWCGMIEKSRLKDGLIEVDSNFRCRERQLSAALTQLAALRTSRDAQFSLGVEQAVSYMADYFERMGKPSTAIRVRKLPIPREPYGPFKTAAAQQLQEDGK